MKNHLFLMFFLCWTMDRTQVVFFRRSLVSDHLPEDALSPGDARCVGFHYLY